MFPIKNLAFEIFILILFQMCIFCQIFKKSCFNIFSSSEPKAHSPYLHYFAGSQVHKNPILEIQVTSKINWGGLTPPPPPPIIYLDTWISNIDFLYTGNQRINANMVNRGAYSIYEGIHPFIE